MRVIETVAECGMTEEELQAESRGLFLAGAGTRADPDYNESRRENTGD